jgi:hypothetical protein
MRWRPFPDKFLALSIELFAHPELIPDQQLNEEKSPQQSERLKTDNKSWQLVEYHGNQSYLRFIKLLFFKKFKKKSLFFEKNSKISKTQFIPEVTNDHINDSIS